MSVASRLLLVSFLGILLVWLFSSLILVNGSGVVSSVVDRGEVVVVSLDNFDYDLVLFTDRVFSLSVGDEVVFVGKFSSYQGVDQLEVFSLAKVV
jgi:hypothetical protein